MFYFVLHREIVRCAVLEEVKKNTADFIGKDDYKGEKMLNIRFDLHSDLCLHLSF